MARSWRSAGRAAPSRPFNPSGIFLKPIGGGAIRDVTERIDRSLSGAAWLGQSGPARHRYRSHLARHVARSSGWDSASSRSRGSSPGLQAGRGVRRNRGLHWTGVPPALRALRDGRWGVGAPSSDRVQRSAGFDAPRRRGHDHLGWPGWVRPKTASSSTRQVFRRDNATRSCSASTAGRWARLPSRSARSTRSWPRRAGSCSARITAAAALRGRRSSAPWSTMPADGPGRDVMSGVEAVHALGIVGRRSESRLGVVVRRLHDGVAHLTLRRVGGRGGGRLGDRLVRLVQHGRHERLGGCRTRRIPVAQ